MKTLTLTLSLILVAFSANFAHADGGSEAHGGDAVVCFKDMNGQIPVENGQLTPVGRTHIARAMPLDAYRAGLSPRKNPRISVVVNADYQTVLRALHSLFAEIPAFSKLMSRSHQILGDIETHGYATASGLPDVSDSGLPLPLPPDCAQVQVAARQSDQILYDPAIWERFTPFGKAILQFHEELYFVTDDALRTSGGSSVGTQLLISTLLTEDLSPITLAEKMARYGFKPETEPRFTTLTEWQQNRNWLLSKITSALDAVEVNTAGEPRLDAKTLPVLRRIYQETYLSPGIPVGVRTGAIARIGNAFQLILSRWCSSSHTEDDVPKARAFASELAHLAPGE